MKIIIGPEADRHVTDWVAARIPGVSGTPENARAIGVADDGDVLVAGVVFSNWNGASLEASIASVGPGWATRRTLRAIFRYPFVQLGARALVALTKRRNRHARGFLRRLGFTERGPIPGMYPDDDGIVYSMSRKDCKWI